MPDDQPPPPHPSPQPWPRQEWPGQHQAPPWPAYAPRPPKPEAPLKRALWWTALFSFLGLLLLLAALAVVAAMLVFMALLVYIFWLSLGGEGEMSDFWEWLPGSDLVHGLLGPAGLVLAGVAVLAFAVCAGILLLLRLSDPVRRWAAPLQALTACGVAYVGGSTALFLVFQFVSALR